MIASRSFCLSVMLSPPYHLTDPTEFVEWLAHLWHQRANFFLAVHLKVQSGGERWDMGQYVSLPLTVRFLIFSSFSGNISCIWALTRQNLSSGVSDRVRLKPVFSATETNLKIKISPVASLETILSNKRITKAMISLHRLISTFVVCKKPRRQVFSRRGP